MGITRTNPFQKMPWYDSSNDLIPGTTVQKKTGYNGVVGTTWSVISSAGVYQTPTSPVSLEIVSSAAQDAQDDIGAHEITIIGLDANWAKQTVTVATDATNGTTPAAVTGTWLRVTSAYVSVSGTYATSGTGSHVGTITIRQAGSGTTWATIPLINTIGAGRALIGCYTVPIGYEACLFQVSAGVESNKIVSMAMIVRENANDVTTPYSGASVMSFLPGLGGGLNHSLTGDQFPFGHYHGPTDIIFTGYVPSGTAAVSIELEMLLTQT